MQVVLVYLQWFQRNSLLKSRKIHVIFAILGVQGRFKVSSHGRISENIELVEELICSHESALFARLQKSARTWEMNISRSSQFRALQSMIFGWKCTSACQCFCHSIDGATFFSKVVFNKLRSNVKNKITLICAKFGTDLANTSKVTSRKTRWPVFWASL